MCDDTARPFLFIRHKTLSIVFYDFICIHSVGWLGSNFRFATTTILQSRRLGKSTTTLVLPHQYLSSGNSCVPALYVTNTLAQLSCSSGVAKFISRAVVAKN